MIHVASAVARRAARDLGADAPVGEHLADPLKAPLAVLPGGTYRSLSPSGHARTNAAVIEAFLPGAVPVDARGEEDSVVRIAGRVTTL